jgi:type VI secretion system protein ImpG
VRPLYETEGTTSSQDAFWVARRVLSERADLSGTDIYLSFVDLSFRPSLPPRETAFAHLLCTNRDLASQLPENALLQTEEPGPIAYIRCLARPTPTGYPPLGGASRWALISCLSLNKLSLTDGNASLEAFRRVLELYSLSRSAFAQKQIHGIRAMSTRTITRRITNGARESLAPWQNFRQGYQVKLTLDENAFAGGSAFLFGRVLREFFVLYSGINSFTELIATTGNEAS